MTWTRRRELEWMDDPTLDAAQHRQALNGLRRVNSWSRSGAAIWQAISNLAVHRQLREIHILDLAMGGGDVAIRLAQSAARANLRVMITGCDISPVAVAEAQRRALAAGARNVEFRPLNVLRDELPCGYDVVMCSLFLHHLDDSEALLLLKRMRDAARQLVLIDDLRRTWLGYWLAWLGCRVLTRSRVVHKDGPLSVAGAFTSTEACDLAQRAGLLGATITHHWPQRFLLRWSRP
jgi:2-polyprenyl-3-methyl-5-hydroxy-6-metoxy-1,4-benzoquinol methylase